MGSFRTSTWCLALALALCLASVNASDLTATLTASPTSAPINTMVTLTCMAFENDTITEVAIANVTWQQGNNALPVDSNSTSIQVTADAPGNVNFTCTLTDDQGQSAVASVLVEFFNNASAPVPAPSLYTMLSANPKNTAVNTFVTLECLAYGSANIANVTWMRDGAFLAVTEKNTLNATSTTAGSVTFNCTLVDDQGRQGTATETVVFTVVLEAGYQPVQVNMSADASRVKVGTTVEVQCFPDLGQEPFNVTWRKNGVELTGETGNFLHLTSFFAQTINVDCVVSDGAANSATGKVSVEFYFDTCAAGQGYSRAQAKCVACNSTLEYNDGSRQTCVYCNHTTGQADACNPSDPAKTTKISKKDICITSSIWSVKCDVSSPTLEEINRGLTNDFRVFYRSAFPEASGMCANAACENLKVTAARKSQLCQILACNAGGGGECGFNFKSTVKACLYAVDEFVHTGVGSIYRRAEEILLESLQNIDQFPSPGVASTTFMTGLMLTIPPSRVDSVTIPADENREMMVHLHTDLNWSDSELAGDFATLNPIIQSQVPPMFGQSSKLLIVTLSDISQYTEGSSGFVQFTLSLVFSKAIDDALVERVAEIGARTHNMSNGRFGNSTFGLQNEIHIFRSRSDMLSGRGGVTWCAFLETLSESLSLTYCEETADCSDTDLWFQCTVDDTLKRQRDLYPYGTNAGDQVLVRDGRYWYYYYISNTIDFTSGAPFGSRKMKYAHVLPNGVITFDRPIRAWWPYLYRAQRYRERNILAPFWHNTNYYANSGKVYYHLYEKPGADGTTGASSPTVDTWSAVLNRAKGEVEETLGVQGFSPISALVATWERVEPRNWWQWICRNYERYRRYWWWGGYYQYYYTRYCLSQSAPEMNTFQCVYVTDGQLAYAITTYKVGEMNWLYDRWRYIDIGFTSPSKTLDFGYRRTDLTTKLTTNTFNTGRYGTWIEQVGEVENTDAKCTNFFIENQHLLFNATHQALLDNLYECPCNIALLGFQWTWYSWDRADWRGPRTYKFCYFLGRKSWDPRIRDNPHNKICCYYYTYPTRWSWQARREARENSIYISFPDPHAGHVLKHDPYWRWWWRSGANARLSQQEDLQPKSWCIRDSSNPSVYGLLFQNVRPDMGCTYDRDWFLGRAMGDPHITTLDTKSYTFNGKGEYILVQADSINFSLQGRTDQAVNSEGNLTRATVFVAFAAKESNHSTFQVELDDAKTGLIITANGKDISTAFYADANYTFASDTLTVGREERNSTVVVTAAFPSNMAMEVYVGIKNLEFTLTVPTSLKGKTKGLMGNYNDDSSDDFILPDGTVLASDRTDTERKIFENFGRQWEVTSSTSVFKYAPGESALTYQFTKQQFEPLFREEANQTLLREAEQTCGAQQDACIFDLLATGDQTFAEATKNSAEENADVQESLKNNLPRISVTTTALNSQGRWQVTHGQEATLTFSATDADTGDTVTFELVEAVNGVSLGSSSGIVQYTPDYASPVLIGVRASDGKGKSQAVYVSIVVCTGCSNNGSCNWSQTRETEYENGRFLISSCSCWPAYTGDDCDQDIDGCADDPCGDDVNCTDISAADQGNQTTGYLCESCPDGYSLLDSSCEDTNECISNGTDPVCPDNSDCLNTQGSYSCSCSTGYRTDPADKTKCKDVDECSEQRHDCQQVCENTPGSFKCSCHGGNMLNPDNKTCISTASCTETCDHFCQQNGDGSTQCSCRRGYELAADNKTCNDIDECSGKSPCTQGCTNTVGGFTCSCFTGFKLASDGTSCEECETSYWGLNCAKQCQCNGRGTCDKRKGCVCETGWTGTGCVKDVNECATNGACHAGQTCTNTIGSFKCSCPTGKFLDNGVCKDIDECENILLNTCDLTIEDCINNEGSYSCVCRSGYARNTENVCTDIDECGKQNHGCQQICENTEGSYNCACYLGYRLDTDRQTCVQKSDPCEGVSNLNCSQICTLNMETSTATCACNSGYGLVGTETCEDIDECKFDHLNLCSYKLGCNNTMGGFQCSCEIGSKLDNDERSCLACGTGTWGENCVNSCDCDAQGASSCNVKDGCVCNTGFTGTKCDKDVDECASGARTCEAGEKCVNTRGSSECQCIDGYRRVLGSCTDIDECAIASNNDCAQVCTNFAGGYECSCNRGYKKTGNSCTDIDECTLKLDGCEQGCENSDGSYRCTCPDGLKLTVDAVSCVVAATCTRTDCTDKCAHSNGTDTCFCSRGKTLNTDGFTCDDVDLCVGAPCNGSCAEIDSGTNFTCSCSAGQKLAGDGFSCSDCVEGTYGTECSQSCNCNAIGSSSCDKVSGTCACNAGWGGGDCSVDVDECTANQHNCSAKAFSTCDNTPGSFVCKCNEGYYTNNGQCSPCQQFTSGDECATRCNCDRQHSSGCDAVSGMCTCNAGWTGSDCATDIDECSGSNSCTQANRPNWVCRNLPGSYECQCEPGYQDTNSICTDLDECAAAFTNECSQNCSNTIGNYTCSCNSGYVLAANGRTCEDEDECTKGTHACEDECANTEASYTCSCGTGREIETNGQGCYNAVSLDSTLTLVDLDASDLNLRERQGADYITMAGHVTSALTSHFEGHATGTKITVTDLRSGSVIVDFTSVINTEIHENPHGKLADAMVAMATNGISINGVRSSAQVVIGSLTVTSDTHKCTILEALSACGAGETCRLSESGSAYCDSNSSDVDDYDIPLIVGLSVGIPLGIKVIVAIVAAVWYMKKYKGQKRVNSRIDHYNDEPERSSPRPTSDDPFSIFQANQMKNQLIDDPLKSTD